MEAVTKSEHLAAAVENRRKELRMSPGDLAERSGLSAQALRNVRNGVVREYQERLTIPLTRALGWSPDSIDRLLAGDDPIVIDQPGPTPTRDVSISDLQEAIDFLKAAAAKTEDRDKKLSQIIKLCQELTANQAAMERRVSWNSAQIDRMLHHFGIEAAPLSSVPE